MIKIIEVNVIKIIIIIKFGKNDRAKIAPRGETSVQRGRILLVQISPGGDFCICRSLPPANSMHVEFAGGDSHMGRILHGTPAKNIGIFKISLNFSSFFVFVSFPIRQQLRYLRHLPNYK